MLHEIQQLYGRYAHALRGDDLDALVGCFTEDARFSLQGVGTFAGHGEIRRLLAGMADDRPRHHISDVCVASAERDAARTLAHFTLLHRRTGTTLAYGHYEDVAVRSTAGEWRWSERSVVFDWRSSDYGKPPSTRSSEPVV
jgi:3-phenylpropionate/cinnamic acid dioxygenase small subunit